MSRTRGFTLIEVLVALTVTATVVLAAHDLFTGVADATKAVSNHREALDRSSNARRLLKATFLSLEPPFEGRVNQLSFSAWQLVPAGWTELRKVRLVQDHDRLIMQSADGAIAVAQGVNAVAFDYLLEPGADTRWVREWISPVSAPLAVRLRITGCGRHDAICTDTLLLLIKERG